MPFDISKRQGFNYFSTLEAILANHVLHGLERVPADDSSMWT